MAGRFAIAIIAALSLLAGLRAASAEPPTRASWPHDAAPSAEYNPASGRINVSWQTAANASAYITWWVNNSDRFDSGAARTTETVISLSRNGGFTDGEWKIRVRAANGGAWSKPTIVAISGAPPELILDIESSRELCTEGTLTELRWSADGGTSPLNLQINGEPVGELDGTAKVNCGLIPRTADGEIDESQRDAVITGFLRDGRGTIKSASIRVPRAEALPAPIIDRKWGHIDNVTVDWISAATHDDSATTLVMQRYMLSGDTQWMYTSRNSGSDQNGVWLSTARTIPAGGLVRIQGAELRDPIEIETPSALRWSEIVEHQVLGEPHSLTIQSTHDTATISWIPVPPTDAGCHDVAVVRGPERGENVAYARAVSGQRSQVSITGLSPDTEYEIIVNACTWEYGYYISTTIRTDVAPADWSPPLRGPQNLRVAATSRTIKVQWDDPFEGATPYYTIQLFSNLGDKRLAGDGIYAPGSDGWSYIFTDLEPNTSYRIRVGHVGLVISHSEIMATTLPVSRPPAEEDISTYRLSCWVNCPSPFLLSHH